MVTSCWVVRRWPSIPGRRWVTRESLCSPIRGDDGMSMVKSIGSLHTNCMMGWQFYNRVYLHRTGNVERCRVLQRRIPEHPAKPVRSTCHHRASQPRESLHSISYRTRVSPDATKRWKFWGSRSDHLNEFLSILSSRRTLYCNVSRGIGAVTPRRLSIVLSVFHYAVMGTGVVGRYLN
jgi:hypothetical protein